MSTIDTTSKIPNNVNLADDRALQRALEHWQPNFLAWWNEMGPDGTHDFDVYLRTAVSVEPGGWAHFDYVKMPDYRWGIFLAPQVPIARSTSASTSARPAWQDVPGEHRANLRRIIVTQGDTEPASVEQQRHLGLTCAFAVRLAQPLPGQRRGRPPPVGDGVPAASLLRPRRPRGGRRAAAAALGRHRQSAHPRRLQREDARLARVLHVHVLHRSRRQVPALRTRRVVLRSARAHDQIHADGGSASHVRRRVGHIAHPAAHLRGDEGARQPTIPRSSAPRVSSTCRPSSAISISTFR